MCGNAGLSRSWTRARTAVDKANLASTGACLLFWASTPGEDCILPGYVDENRDTPNVRNFDDAPEEVKDLVDPFWRGEDAAEGLRALQEMLMTAPARL